jgi:hypothetical protein
MGADRMSSSLSSRTHEHIVMDILSWDFRPRSTSGDFSFRAPCSSGMSRLHPDAALMEFFGKIAYSTIHIAGFKDGIVLGSERGK